MPIEDFERFIKLLTEDREVAEQFQTITGNLAAVIQFGKETGCEFTIEDMRIYHEGLNHNSGYWAKTLPCIEKLIKKKVDTEDSMDQEKGS